MNTTKRTGLAHFFSAAHYSTEGLRRLSRETAFRHEVLLAAFLVLVMTFVGVGLSKLFLGIALLLGIFGAEAINTAVEEIADLVSPDYSLAVKHAKDLGSLMVALTIIAASGYCLAAVIERLFN
jgi:diacylglycerol kinase (ATP)